MATDVGFESPSRAMGGFPASAMLSCVEEVLDVRRVEVSAFGDQMASSEAVALNRDLGRLKNLDIHVQKTLTIT